jgi:hypothetical protein
LSDVLILIGDEKYARWKEKKPDSVRQQDNVDPSLVTRHCGDQDIASSSLYAHVRRGGISSKPTSCVSGFYGSAGVIVL